MRSALDYFALVPCHILRLKWAHVTIHSRLFSYSYLVRFQVAVISIETNLNTFGDCLFVVVVVSTFASCFSSFSPFMSFSSSAHSIPLDGL